MLSIFKFSFFKKVFIKKDSNSDKDLRKILKNGAFIVDLRTPTEFEKNHVKGSINIPLGQMALHFDKFKNHKYIVLCCFTGNRSNFAKGVLEKRGFTNVINGGAWDEIDKLLKF
jgi:phage shock protein E